MQKFVHTLCTFKAYLNIEHLAFFFGEEFVLSFMSKLRKDGLKNQIRQHVRHNGFQFPKPLLDPRLDALMLLHWGGMHFGRDLAPGEGRIVVSGCRGVFRVL